MSQHDENCGGWRTIFRHPGALAGAFIAGGILAFGYSYVPLHGAKNWKIDYQESRLATQREELEALEAKLAAAQAEAGRNATLEKQAPRREELDQARAQLKALEAKNAKLEKEKDKLARSRDSWRSRHAAAEKERDEWKATAAGVEGAGVERAGAERAAAPELADRELPAQEAVPPAAAQAGPVEERVLEGARWTSSDGRASFTLVAAVTDRATLSLEPDGGSIRVEAGSNIRIGDPARGSYRVTVMEIEAGRAIRISAVPENSDLLLAPSGAAASPAP